jgi:lysozyme
MMNMTMSDHGRRLLALWEGFERDVYMDVAGLPTIGVGHLLTKDELSSDRIVIGAEAVDYTVGLTEQQVYDLLGQDLARFEWAVNEPVEPELAQNQFDALVSFTFNVGGEAFRQSTLLRRLNARDFADVPNQLRRWVKSGGRKVQGLVNRRENEIKLWHGEI